MGDPLAKKKPSKPAMAADAPLLVDHETGLSTEIGTKPGQGMAWICQPLQDPEYYVHFGTVLKHHPYLCAYLLSNIT